MSRGDSAGTGRFATGLQPWTATYARHVLSSADLRAHVEVHGPWFFHATPTEDLASILEDGIRPGSELDRSNAPHPFHQTRPGHVYLSTLEHCRQLQAAGDLGAGTIRVDVRRLDPNRIDPDEDLVQHAWHFRGERWIDSDPPLLGPDWEKGPHGEGTLAHWAETTSDFDAPNVTARSLAEGRISYRGTVPVRALELVK